MRRKNKVAKRRFLRESEGLDMELFDFLDRDAEQAVEDALNEWGMVEDVTLGYVGKFMLQASRICGGLGRGESYSPAELKRIGRDDEDVHDVFLDMAHEWSRTDGTNWDDATDEMYDEMYLEFDHAVDTVQNAGYDNYNEYDYMEVVDDTEYTIDDVEYLYWGLIAKKLVHRLRNL